MAFYIVQLKSEVKYPGYQDRFFDYIITEDNLKNELLSGKRFICIRSTKTNITYHMSVDMISYFIELSDPVD
ncbi:MAG: hypothetical protein ETSY1_33105 [Candidatus Entotheonella factor]|uniref:Uncharacterized protein n=1 Tax=Entotheonella factor TaxID=1429438 RepID=W4L9U0_ENTF1|nr:MAG: hypothetical protein ETSY1_33105 [Candidatus Entotheonella factor]